jgi:hypothetical protein
MLARMVIAAVCLIAFQQASRAQLYQPTPAQKHCSEEADALGLHGIERKDFRTRCKQKAAQSPEPTDLSSKEPLPAAPLAALPKRLTAKPVTPSPSFAGAIAETRVALVIGNSGYDKVPLLPNPVNDANDISESLKELGFRVQTVTNANFDEMRRSVISFGRDAQGSDIALVFFAGHGMEIGGENWLIPIDAELLSDTDAESEAISLKTVMLQVTKAKKLGLVILDACRNNPFTAKIQRTVRVRSVDRGFARTEPLDNVLVAYSAKDGTTARDGNGRNSPFTSALLRHIQTPGLEVRFLFANVRDDVMAATQREQQPFVYGSLSSERIYLSLPNAANTSEAVKSSAPRIQAKPVEKPALAIATPAQGPNPTDSPRAVVLPSSVSPKYSEEDAGKARMHTCVDQYNANKATNSNGGLLWIQQGGGYYSECNQHLKN